MDIHLRQICLVARDMAPVRAALTEILGTEPCHIDPGVEKFGLENVLYGIGSQFLEVVAPIREGTAAARYMDRQGGDGGYMVICQAPQAETQRQVRDRAASEGVRVAYESDRDTWQLMQLHPADMGAAFLEVDYDDQEDPQGNWEPAGGQEWRDVAPGAATSISAVELRAPDPQALAARWSAVAGIATRSDGGTPVLPLANADLHFLPDEDGRGARLDGLVLVVRNREEVLARADAIGCRTSDDAFRVCGTMFRLSGS